MSFPTAQCPPKHADVLIIGGGPAGSYAAAALAREGISVVLYEASKFPRYHVGESLIPSVRHYARFIDVEDKITQHNFRSKPGSAIKFNQYKREGYTDFVALGAENSAFNVIRSEFDHLLLNHARAVGAAVYEKTTVTSLSFSSVDPTRPICAHWKHVPPPGPPSPPASPTRPFHSEPEILTGATTFNYLVDATGRQGIMSTKYLKNRHFNNSLKNVAAWGYWEQVQSYGVGTPREGAPFFEALTNETGWAWFIPLHDGTTSVGVVMNQETYNSWPGNNTCTSPFSVDATPDLSNSTTLRRYIEGLAYAPGIVKLISAQGKLRDGVVKMASDFSYSAPSYAGKGYRIVGDAGAFIDPFFSSGIHLAMTSALTAAATICASLKGDCSEEEAAEWHTKRVSTSYTRFQVVVLSAYKQIRAQQTDVLCDIDEDNYDRAFSFLRPVIQGAADMGSCLSENELQKSLDFCVKLFHPTTPEEHENLARGGRIDKGLLDVTGPVIHPAILDNALRVKHESSHSNLAKSEATVAAGIEERQVLEKINARRVMHAEYGINNLELEALDGYAIRLKRGELGLIKVPKGMSD